MANHQPGLPSLNEARAQRRRQIVTGKAKTASLPIELDFDGTHAHIARVHWSTHGVVG